MAGIFFAFLLFFSRFCGVVCFTSPDLSIYSLLKKRHTQTYEHTAFVLQCGDLLGWIDAGDCDPILLLFSPLGERENFDLGDDGWKRKLLKVMASYLPKLAIFKLYFVTVVPFECVCLYMILV